jgi:dephospho-CoA kinase
VLRVGLTGGMACGKSAVLQMLAARGAYVLEADTLAHDLMRPGTTIYHEIVRQFGRGILEANGAISRPKLARAAFSGPQGSRIAELNAIVHPAVLEHQRKWMNEISGKDTNAVVVVAAALLLEAGAKQDFDKLIVVSCRPEQKIERLSQRLGVDEQSAALELQRRSAAQWPDREKIAAADYLIENSGSLAETEMQVDTIFAELKRLATQNA